MKITGEIFVIASVFIVNFSNGQYTPPNAKVEPLSPKGIRISVPNEPGMTLVAFHVKFNEDFHGLEAGTIARDIVRNKNGRWTYEDRTTRLRTGDIIYYWIHVIYEGLGYNLLDQQHQVNEFYDANGGKVIQDNGEGSSNGPCGPTATKIVDPQTGSQRDVCAGQLLINETFDRLNETLWRKIERFTGSPDYAFVVYRNDERNVKCIDGNLQITPILMTSEFGEDFIYHGNMILERCTEGHGSVDCGREALGPYILPPISSGLLDTKNSFAILYGKIQIRAKLPHGDWIYPILRLETSSSSSINPQLRIAFSTGNSILRESNGKDFSGHVLFGGPVSGNPGNHRSMDSSKRYSSNLWSDDYHTFELEWRRDKIFSRVDGIEFGSVETKSPFDKPFYLNVGLAVGGHDEFPDSLMSDGYAKPWRNVGSKAQLNFVNSTDSWSKTWNSDGTKLKIDYIKVWAL